MNINFKPTRGCKLDYNKLIYPVYASIKIDGIRVNLIDNKARTKSLKTLPNKHVRSLLETSNILKDMEGELTTSENLLIDECFNKSTSAFMSHDYKPEFIFWVFDIFKQQLKFHDRYKLLCTLKDNGELPPFVRIVEQRLINNKLELELFYSDCVFEGHEGVIVRHYDSLYKCGMATTSKGELLKMKPMEDSECVIVGFEEGTINTNPSNINELGYYERSSSKDGKVPSGLIGTILGKHEVWGIIRISGFKVELSKDMFDYPDKYLGKIVTFKYQSHGTLNKPRIAKFKGFRDINDM